MNRVMLKKIIPFVLIIICIFSSCVPASNHESTTEQSQSKLLNDKIFAVIYYDCINPDYSVYTPEYFGDSFSECKIYDLYANYGLCITLTIKSSERTDIDNIISDLQRRNDIFKAEICTDEILKGLKEYTPEKSPVKLCNRRFPFTSEFTGFEYDRDYRMIYYYGYEMQEFYDFVSSEELSQWREYYYDFNDFYTNGISAKEPKEMALVSFIKYFNISKADFENKIKEVTQIFMETSGGDAFRYHTEQYELPNADILYTFDNDVINEYYRYE